MKVRIFYFLVLIQSILVSHFSHKIGGMLLLIAVGVILNPILVALFTRYAESKGWIK